MQLRELLTVAEITLSWVVADNCKFMIIGTVQNFFRDVVQFI